MKVAFYLQNKGIKEVDCSCPMVGNPGIGGSEYMFIAIPFSLWAKSNSCHQVFLMANSISQLPKHINCKYVPSDGDLRESLDRFRIDAVVLRYSFDNLKIVESLPSNIKVILWAHNFIRREELSKLANDNRITCIVCVGNEQLQMYRDHQAYYKSVAIFNGYPIHYFLNNQSSDLVPFTKRGNEVTYLGNLVSYKGFHLLAKAWKQILAEVPDAHLNVIGGGKLYDRNQKLGKWEIAEETYENKFIQYLTEEDGNILSSVTFHGVLGNEKSKILSQTKVGVPNPSGISETFCIAALEMQLYGAVVSTINYGGFKDTVYSTGHLYDSPEDLAKSVIQQLKRPDNDYSGFIEFSKQFDFAFVAQCWIKLFDTLQYSNDVSTLLKPECTKDYRWVEMNRRIKKMLPLGKHLPSTMFYKSIFRRIGTFLNLN